MEIANNYKEFNQINEGREAKRKFKSMDELVGAIDYYMPLMPGITDALENLDFKGPYKKEIWKLKRAYKQYDGGLGWPNLKNINIALKELGAAIGYGNIYK